MTPPLTFPSPKPPRQRHWDEELARHPEDPKLWRALAKAFFPMQVPMFLPFLVVTAAKIVQAHVGVKGLIEALDSNRPPSEVRCGLGGSIRRATRPMQFDATQHRPLAKPPRLRATCTRAWWWRWASSS